MSIRIAADSTCDLSKELIDRYHVAILPLHILLGEEDHRDGVDIVPSDIFRWSDEHNETPKTSAPSPEEARSFMKSLLPSDQDPDPDLTDILVFTISSEMSATPSILQIAASDLGGSVRFHIVDSKNLSTAIGLLVIEAAELAEKGASAAEILEVLERDIPKVRASFVVDTLTFLARGGRCSSVAALMGSTFKLHPKIVVENGKMHSTKKYRGKMEAVLLKYAQDMEEELLRAKTDHVFITHSTCPPEYVEPVKAYVESLGRFKNIHITTAGGVISSHCGPGTLGVLFIEG